MRPDPAGVPRVRLVLPTWEDYLSTAIEDLLPIASASMVLQRVHRLLTNLLDISPPPGQAALIRLIEQVQAPARRVPPALK